MSKYPRLKVGVSSLRVKMAKKTISRELDTDLNPG